MKRTKSWICVLLILSALLLLGSCGEKEGPTQPTQPSQTTDETGPATANDTDDLPAEVLNLNGQTITIYSFCQQFAAEEFGTEDSSTTIGKAVVERNDSVERRLNCLIEVDETIGDTVGNVAYDFVSQMVNGGLSSHQIINTASFKMASMAINGMFANLYDCNHINLEKDYYSQGYNEALSLGNAQFCVTGKFTISYYRYMIVTFFNKGLFDSNLVDYPYQTVRAGNWTFEEMGNLAKEFYVDQGESGKDADDILGFAGFVGNSSSQTDGYMSSCNLRVIQKDENNFYRIDVDREAFSNAIDNVFKLYNSAGTYVSSTFTNEDTTEKFINGEAAMINYRLYFVEDGTLRNSDMADKYGILPLPKSDTNQENYYSYVQDQCFLWGIPRVYGGQSLQDIGVFIEAFASASYHTVKDAYYEISLTLKYVNDPDSREMLQLMDSTVYVDPVNFLNNNGDNSIRLSTNALRSIYESGFNTVINKIDSELEGDMERLERINGQVKELLGVS